MAVDNHSRIIVPYSGLDKPRDSQAQQDIKDVTTHSVRHCHVTITWKKKKAHKFFQFCNLCEF